MTCVTVEDLKVLTEAIAPVIEPGDVILLYGELGAGKTTLTQLLAKALGVGEEQYVSSPSFALLHEYRGNKIPISHMDLYRLRDEDDVEAAGLFEAFPENGLCIVEWPDRLGSSVPPVRLDIEIRHDHISGRQLVLTPHGISWATRMNHIARSASCLSK
ncbi:MAG: tRNA (adenosine(37)-N6)-threonylcarbamoyltransferase complex ATPase subunit type 1 TsaE [Desulfobulbus sp.]|nr:tRNA (adenosine(37)-N6)-threonylcarbamoyltransferase complex ATPase subunit type 1 TsaE [Desulfobulbus sp.]